MGLTKERRMGQTHTTSRATGTQYTRKVSTISTFFNTFIDQHINTSELTYLCCDLEVFVLFKQLLCVVNAGAGGCVCGQVKLPGVMDPLQGLRTQPIMNEFINTAGILVTQWYFPFNFSNPKTHNRLPLITSIQ